jgi:hypothetical protein
MTGDARILTIVADALISAGASIPDAMFPDDEINAVLDQGDDQ